MQENVKAYNHDTSIQRQSWAIDFGKELIKDGKLEEAITILNDNFPPITGQVEFYLVQMKLLKKWSMQFEEWVNLLPERSSGWKCETCGKGCHQWCNGCNSVYYCGRRCKDKDRQKHIKECKMTRLRRFNRLALTVVDNMWQFTVRDRKDIIELERDNPPGKYVPIMNGFSFVLAQPDHHFGYLARSFDSILKRHHVLMATSIAEFFNHTETIGAVGILMAYYHILKDQWKEAVKRCYDVITKFPEIAGAAGFLRGMCLYNLGYCQRAQQDIMGTNLICQQLAMKARSPEDVKKGNQLRSSVGEVLDLLMKGEGLFPDKEEQKCFGCNKKLVNAEKILRCGSCKEAKYCKKECQKTDYDFHKMICKDITNVDFRVMTPGDKKSEKNLTKMGYEKSFDVRTGLDFWVKGGLKHVDIAGVCKPNDTLQSFVERMPPPFVVCAGPGCKDGNPKHQCARCKKVKYCSKVCQVLHWENGHKKACRKPCKQPDDVDGVTSSIGKLKLKKGEENGDVTSGYESCSASEVDVSAMSEVE